MEYFCQSFLSIWVSIRSHRLNTKGSNMPSVTSLTFVTNTSYLDLVSEGLSLAPLWNNGTALCFPLLGELKVLGITAPDTFADVKELLEQCKGIITHLTVSPPSDDEKTPVLETLRDLVPQFQVRTEWLSSQLLIAHTRAR